MFALFPEESFVSQLAEISGDEMPEPYRELLVHSHHMTVTMEAFHQDTVTLKVCGENRVGDQYARVILLSLESTGQVVQFGIMRFDLSICNRDTRDEILDGTTPLGRILIQKNIMRRIVPETFLKIVAGESLATYFDCALSQEVYGRLAVIECNGQPAVELLEVSASVDTD